MPIKCWPFWVCSMVTLLLLIIPLPEPTPSPEVDLVEWNWICDKDNNSHQIILWRRVAYNNSWEVAQWQWIDPESVHVSRRFEDGYKLVHVRVLDGSKRSKGWILVKTRSFIKTAGIDREIQDRQHVNTNDRQPYDLPLRPHGLYLHP